MFSANSSQVSGDRLFVEDVFSTYLYTGNGASSQTITNGIDLSGKGGMVWIKSRNVTGANDVWDTSRGANNLLVTNETDGQGSGWASSFGFGSSGFSLTGSDGSTYSPNRSGVPYASWTFREAPKFFDVVTYTGNGANRNIAHNLGSVPGMILVKRTNTAGDWQVYHRSNANTQYMVLNNTSNVVTGTTRWNSTTPTATEFTVGTDATVNASGGTYVAYLYAHDAGGFGNAGTDSVISCGSYTGNGSATGPVINLGWEPQWLLIKQSSGSSYSWMLMDNMRGMPVGGADAFFTPNFPEPEYSVQLVDTSATGFSPNTTLADVNASGQTYIYMAIRRGPMRTPTLGTSVFAPVAWTGTGGTATIPAGFAVDLVISKTRSTSNPPVWFDRLRGPLKYLGSSNIAAESSLAGSLTGFDNNTGVTVGADTSGGVINYSSRTFAEWMFRRAPGFFDVVCYTGNNSFRAINHNLGVVPELIITKARTDNNAFPAWYTPTTLGASTYNQLLLQDTGGLNIYSYGFGSSLGSNPTSELIYLGQNDQLNGVGPYVAYLFASCPGVSKVGEYTGNGTSQTINCGFAAGARFVMIKRTGSINSDWYVWDTARGIVAGNDPHLSLNTTATEVTTDDTIDADSSGFVVNQVAATNVNVNYASYIYLAIA